MNKPAAFRATYSEWKTVKTRRVVQIVFEVPWEEHDQAYQALGGMADPAKERWFAIARLNDGKGVVQPETVTIRSNTTDMPPDVQADKPVRRAVSPDKRLAQQAGIACSNPLFWQFLYETWPEANITGEVIATEFIRKSCGVKSRSEITPGTIAGNAWESIYSRYLTWRDHPDIPLTDCQREHA